MEHQNYLGIYLNKDNAFVVVASHNKPVSGFAVQIEPDDTEENQNIFLAQAIAEKLAEKNLKINTSSAAIDCRYYTQHDIHSRFTDPKQIAQTIKFDAEEVLAADVLEKAICYHTKKVDDTGTDLRIFSADKKELTDTLIDMQNNRIDPFAMEPDTICLARFVKYHLKDHIKQPEKTIALFIDSNFCYLVLPEYSKNSPNTRSFLLNPSQDNTPVITRQITLTTASLTDQFDIDSICIMDTTGKINPDTIEETVGIKTEKIDLAQLYLNSGVEIPNDQLVDASIAYGAALSVEHKAERIDFRKDFLPYQGKREAVQNTMKYLSICLSVILLAAGLYFQTKIFQRNSYIKQLNEKTKHEANLVGISKRRLDSKESVINILKAEINKIKAQKEGKLSLESGSIEARLNFILEAINNTPTGIDLNVQTIDITSRTMRITGDTNSRNSTQKLFDSIKKHPQLIIDERFSKTTSGRDNFRVTIKTANN